MQEGMLFAGVGGFQLFPEQEPEWAVEIEPFCQAVLRSRFPRTEIFSDVRECHSRKYLNSRARKEVLQELLPVDIITAGVP